MNNSEIEKLCIALIKADSENEVIEILESKKLWNNPDVWRWYGDRENNYKDAGNQAAEAEASLVEKLTNSRDARLLNECHINNLDPEGKDAPLTLKDAVGKFFEEHPNSSSAGQIKDWTDTKRTEIARGITVAITGNKPDQGYPSISIADIGEGQTPLKVPKTILSLGESIKMRIPFVHGKFNMGGTAALRFCGYHNLQLVVSRRNPKLVNGENESDSNWGFTIVRRNYPKGSMDSALLSDDKTKSSIYTYLAPINALDNKGKGEILNFSSEKLKIFPKGNIPYHDCSEWGTFIKLYEFKTRYRTHMFRDGGLLRPLDLLLPRVGLPIRLHECRDYKGHEGSFETTLTGLRVRLEDDKEKNLEQGFPDSSELNVDGNNFKVTIYAFKEGKARIYRNADKGILFTVNGQTQGWFSERFFGREKRVGLQYIKDSLIVIVDCSNISFEAQEKLFLNSRDRLSTENIRYQLEEGLEELLRKHPGLRELKERRRREKKAEKLEDSKAFEKVLKTVFRNSKSLASFFSLGDRLSNPFKTEDVASVEKSFQGERFPQYFKFRKINYGITLKRDCHIDCKCRIAFETDVENSYFDRNIDAGTFQLYQLTDDGKEDVQNYNLNLYNGIANLSLTLPEEIQEGMTLSFRSEVTDPTRIIEPPFINEFELNIIHSREETEKNNTKNKRRNPPDDKGEGRETPLQLSIPNPTEVFKNKKNGSKVWSDFTPNFDKETALRVIYAGEDGDNASFAGYDFFINMDNIYLNYEIKSSPEDADAIMEQYKIGMVLTGMSLIHEHIKGNKSKNNIEKEENGEDGEMPISELIGKVTTAFSPIILPLINELADLPMIDD